MADADGHALLDADGNHIALPVDSEGTADLSMLPKELRDIVQEKGQTLEEGGALPDDVKADLDAFDFEKAKQLKSLNAFIQWCRDRAVANVATDNALIDELEEVGQDSLPFCFRESTQKLNGRDTALSCYSPGTGRPKRLPAVPR